MDSCLMKTKCIVTYCLHRPSNNNNTTIITLTTTTNVTIAFSDGDNFGPSHNKWTVLVKISLGVILVAKNWSSATSLAANVQEDLFWQPKAV